MSTLDQAFIRAYQRESANPAATPRNSLRPAPPARGLDEHPTLEQSESEGVVYRVDRGAPAEAAQPPEEAAAGFRPVLQVEGFSWPKSCRRLGRAAPEELDCLADALAKAVSQGRKILAIGGCSAGDGATTMVLCAGRRLAERGDKVLMVDARAADPKLAGRLGILAQHGWEEVLAGQLPLGEAVIETIRGDLAVLPLGESLTEADQPDGYETQLKENLHTLAAYYDVILIDLGSLADPEIGGGPLLRGLTPHLDAIALVRDARAADRDRLAEAEDFLATTGVVQLGIIENFVAH